MNSQYITARVLNYWFGDLSTDPFAKQKTDLWFTASEQTDNEIRERFGNDVARASAGEYEALRSTPHGSLALIILLDQFTRNIYRGTPDAFASDPLALQYALDMIASGQDQKLSPVERIFVYLPLEHAEDQALQEQCVALFDKLRNEVPETDRDFFEVTYDYAVRHKVIIDRFGRFPHRNEILGRESTPEEIEFLKQPGSSF